MKFDMVGNISAEKKGVFLHGMALNGKAMMSLVGNNAFGNDYCLIYPTFDGHYFEGKTIYTNIGDQADKIINFLEKNCGNRIDFIMGASLGAMTAFEMLQRKKLQVRRYIFDGLPFADFSPIKRNIMKFVLGNMLKKAKKNPEKYGSIDKMYGKSAKPIKEFAQFADKQDISNLVDQGFSGKVPEHFDIDGEDIVFVFGSNEDAYPYFKKFQNKYLDGYRLIIKDGYKHCQYFRENIKEYINSIIL
jgi:pimeloyl-ACP methyl ester carboxylesterase